MALLVQPCRPTGEVMADAEQPAPPTTTAQSGPAQQQPAKEPQVYRGWLETESIRASGFPEKETKYITGRDDR